MKKIVIFIYLFAPLFLFAQDKIGVRKANNHYDVYKNDTLLGSLKKKKELFYYRFEVSEQIGLSQVFKNIDSHSPIFYNYYVDANSGLSNQISFSYHFSRRFSLGGAYRYNNWNIKNHSFGLIANTHFNVFSLGADFLETNLPSVVTNLYAVNYAPALSVGVHFGFRQRIFKNFYLKEEVGVNRIFLKSTQTWQSKFHYPDHTESINLDYYYGFLGLSYNFN